MFTSSENEVRATVEPSADIHSKVSLSCLMSTGTQCIRTDGNEYPSQAQGAMMRVGPEDHWSPEPIGLAPDAPTLTSVNLVEHPGRPGSTNRQTSDCSSDLSIICPSKSGGPWELTKSCWEQRRPDSETDEADSGRLRSRGGMISIMSTDQHG